MYANLLK